MSSPLATSVPAAGWDRFLGRAMRPSDAVRIAARLSPYRGMLYFCMLAYERRP
jgi:hypothetical protein